MMRKNPVGLIVVAISVIACSAYAATDFSVLHNFGGKGDGSVLSGPPVVDDAGHVYGATGAGGASGFGIVFELTSGSNGQWTESVLFQSSGWYEDGSPDSGVAIDGKGGLYGTSSGGPNGLAVVYQLMPKSGGWNFSLIYDVGAGPGITLDSAGNPYGNMGSGRCKTGAISELIPSGQGWGYDPLYSFGCGGDKNGYDPLAPLSWDSKGNLYGTTYDGGGIGLPNCVQGSGCGVAFEVIHNARASNAAGAWSYEVIHRFASTATDGQSPYGSLTLDGQGNVYGTTAEGGLYNDGTVFELQRVGPSVWTEIQLYDFPTLSLGGAPGNNLVFDKAGNLYGVAGGGDLSCPLTCGVVFRLSPAASGQWNYNVVHFFHGSDGANPLGLAIDANGGLFGTTQTGGTYDRGVAFEITP